MGRGLIKMCKVIAILILVIHFITIGVTICILFTLTGLAIERLGWLPLTLTMVWAFFNSLFILVPCVHMKGRYGNRPYEDMKHIEGHDLLKTQYPCLTNFPIYLYGTSVVGALTIFFTAMSYIPPNLSDDSIARTVSAYLYLFYFTIAFFPSLFFIALIYYFITISVRAIPSSPATAYGSVSPRHTLNFVTTTANFK